MVSEGYVVAILGKAIIPYQDLRRAMDAFVRQSQFNTELKIYIAFVKLEKVRRRKFGTDQFMGGYDSIFPPITPQMLTDMESDNPMVTLHLLNTSNNERRTSPCVPNNFIGDVIRSKWDFLAIPYIVLSQRPEDSIGAFDCGFNCNIVLIERVTHGTTPANERPIVHMLSDLQVLNDKTPERGELAQYAGWNIGDLVGIGYLSTCEAIEESADGADRTN